MNHVNLWVRRKNTVCVCVCIHMYIYVHTYTLYLDSYERVHISDVYPTMLVGLLVDTFFWIIWFGVKLQESWPELKWRFGHSMEVNSLKRERMCLLLVLFLWWSYCIVPTGLELTQADLKLVVILLPLPLKSWDYRNEPLYLVETMS